MLRIDCRPQGNLDNSVRLQQIEQNLARGLPALRDKVPPHDRELAIVGGGPGLDISKVSTDMDIWALNGTLNELVRNGRCPDAFVMLDGRASNVEFVKDAPRGVTYYIASQCHPDVFEALKDRDVIVWNARTEHEENRWPDHMWIGGGSTVGVRAMFMAYLLGYRDIHFHGFDSCYLDGRHHAYDQAPGSSKVEQVWFRGKEYTVEPWMMAQAREFIEQARYMQNDGVTMTVHPPGLIHDMYTSLSAPDEIRERQKYWEIWKVDSYRQKNHGHELWTNHRELFGNPDSAIDFGCGLGWLMAQWNEENIDGWGIDIAPNCLDRRVALLYADKFRVGNLWDFDMGRTFDLGVCADVMEHIPPQHVDAAIANIKRHCKKVVFKIANYPHVVRGFQLHMTIEPVEWWLEKIGGEQVPYKTDRDEFVLTV